MQLAALARSLAASLLDQKDKINDIFLPHALPWWIEHDNHYASSRIGLDACYVCNRQGDVRSLWSVWKDVAEAVQPYAESLGEMAYLQRLITRVNEKHLAFARQRACYKESDNMRSVVTDLVAELDAELAQVESFNNVE